MPDIKNWIDILFGRKLTASGTQIVQRTALEFGSGCTATDDPVNDRTVLTFSGGGGGGSGNLDVATQADMRALVVTGFSDGQQCWVRTVKRAYHLETTALATSAALDTFPSASAGRIWIGIKS